MILNIETGHSRSLSRSNSGMLLTGQGGNLNSNQMISYLITKEQMKAKATEVRDDSLPIPAFVSGQ